MSEELKPCPWCGDLDLHPKGQGALDAHYIACDSCGASGPLASDAELAGDLWNGQQPDELQRLQNDLRRQGEQLVEAMRVKALALAELEALKALDVSGLVDALEKTRDTIDGQLTIIFQRAPGKYLDKVPVVRSLKAHWARCSQALLDYRQAQQREAE